MQENIWRTWTEIHGSLAWTRNPHRVRMGCYTCGATQDMHEHDPVAPWEFRRAHRHTAECFQPCEHGDRVATCYHVPRCSRTRYGFGRFTQEVS